MRIITDYLDQTASRYPDKIAFVDSRRSITFGALQHEAFHIASKLISLNIHKSPVAIFLDKTVECPVAFMGVAYSGNFYTMIDVKMPTERVHKILDTLDCKVILTNNKYKEKISELRSDIVVLSYEDLQASSYNKEEIYNTTRQIIDTDVLYVLFTSGSTGNPKGVIIPHRAVVAYTEWGTKAFDFNETTIFGNQTPFYFSMSVLDIYNTIKNGATMFIIPKMFFMFPVKLLEYISEHKINTIYWVPTALCWVANNNVFETSDISCLKKILFAGEAMPAKQLNIWRRALPDAMYANLFGPTEVTDICNYYIVNREISDDESVPIGEACENTGILILDEENKPVQGHEMGELCVRGTTLAYGYYNNPEKTAEAFVQNPLNSSYQEIIYRTGDLVRYNEHNELIYVSRKDFQIKHLGYRIELGEIETAVSSIDGVTRNCCVFDEIKDRIVLFYSGNTEENQVVKKLKLLVPHYMIPALVIHMDLLPVNLNGKIDRHELKNILNKRKED